MTEHIRRVYSRALNRKLAKYYVSPEAPYELTTKERGTISSSKRRGEKDACDGICNACKNRWRLRDMRPIAGRGFRWLPLFLLIFATTAVVLLGVTWLFSLFLWAKQRLLPEPNNMSPSYVERHGFTASYDFQPRGMTEEFSRQKYIYISEGLQKKTYKKLFKSNRSDESEVNTEPSIDTLGATVLDNYTFGSHLVQLNKNVPPRSEINFQDHLEAQDHEYSQEVLSLYNGNGRGEFVTTIFGEHLDSAISPRPGVSARRLQSVISIGPPEGYEGFTARNMLDAFNAAPQNYLLALWFFVNVLLATCFCSWLCSQRVYTKAVIVSP